MKPKKLIAIRHCVLNVVPGDKRGAKPKNVAILADSLPLNASRQNTMFFKKLATSPVCLF